MNKIFVKIEGIHCSHCEEKIKKKLKQNRKIKEVDIKRHIAEISYEGKLKNQEIINAIHEIDYETKNEFISTSRKSLDDTIQLKEFLIILIGIVLLVSGLKLIFGFNIFNMIPTIDSSITYGMLVITGLLTSIHCISMCGAINLVAVMSKQKRSLKRPILYNMGRVLSYTLVGGIVGFIGSVLSISNVATGIVILLAAILMFVMSLYMLGIVSFQLPPFIRIKTSGGKKSAFIIGILNGFMPCGPLQAMQIYALGTGSFYKGALSMFLFGIGTVPLMLLVGFIVNIMDAKRKILVNKIAAVFILVLSVIMINRGLLSLNIDFGKFFKNYGDFKASVLYDDYQVIEFDLSYNNYEDILLQKDVPVKMIIHVDKQYLTGCNNQIIIQDFGIVKTLEVGDNIIEFTPTETGVYTYTCWMNMIKNNIKVIDDVDYF